MKGPEAPHAIFSGCACQTEPRGAAACCIFIGLEPQGMEPTAGDPPARAWGLGLLSLFEPAELHARGGRMPPQRLSPLRRCHGRGMGRLAERSARRHGLRTLHSPWLGFENPKAPPAVSARIRSGGRGSARGRDGRPLAKPGQNIPDSQGGPRSTPHAACSDDWQLRGRPT